MLQVSVNENIDLLYMPECVCDIFALQAKKTKMVGIMNDTTFSSSRAYMIAYKNKHSSPS